MAALYHQVIIKLSISIACFIALDLLGWGEGNYFFFGVYKRSLCVEKLPFKSYKNSSNARFSPQCILNNVILQFRIYNFIEGFGLA